MYQCIYISIISYCGWGSFYTQSKLKCPFFHFPDCSTILFFFYCNVIFVFFIYDKVLYLFRSKSPPRPSAQRTEPESTGVSLRFSIELKNCIAMFLYFCSLVDFMNQHHCMLHHDVPKCGKLLDCSILFLN